MEAGDDTDPDDLDELEIDAFDDEVVVNVLHNDCCGQDLRIADVTDPFPNLGDVSISSNAKSILYDPGENFRPPYKFPFGSTEITFEYTVINELGNEDDAEVTVVVTRESICGDGVAEGNEFCDGVNCERACDACLRGFFRPANSPICIEFTDNPTASPITSSPTSSPTFSPTSSPTSRPTSSPTLPPTSSPTFSPTSSPTSHPTSSPTSNPSPEPTAPTASPTVERCSSSEQVGYTLKSWYFGHANGGSGKWNICGNLCKNDPDCNSWMWRNSGNACYLSVEPELMVKPEGCCTDHHPFTMNSANC